MKKFCAFFVFLLINNPSYGFSQELLESFNPYRVKTGDTLSKIAPYSQWDIIMRINKIDEKHLPANKIIFIPFNLEKARKFTPLPANICAKRNKRLIYVSLKDQFFGAYENGKLVFWGPISSGKSKHKTPNGKFNVLWKSRKYHSKKYREPMPYAINISRDGYFFHEQSLPGRPASHGCIRLLRQDAKKIFHWANINDSILIE